MNSHYPTKVTLSSKSHIYNLNTFYLKSHGPVGGGSASKSTDDLNLIPQTTWVERDLTPPSCLLTHTDVAHAHMHRE